MAEVYWLGSVNYPALSDGVSLPKPDESRCGSMGPGEPDRYISIEEDEGDEPEAAD